MTTFGQLCVLFLHTNPLCSSAGSGENGEPWHEDRACRLSSLGFWDRQPHSSGPVSKASHWASVSWPIPVPQTHTP